MQQRFRPDAEVRPYNGDMMKLVRFRSGVESRIGAVVDSHVVDLRGAVAAALAAGGVAGDTAQREAARRVPTSMREFLSLGDELRHVVHEATFFVEQYPTHVHDRLPVRRELA